MDTRGMNQTELIAFWVWYKLGFNGGGKRSLKAAGDRVGQSAQTIGEWHKKFDWDRLAEQEDAKLNRKLEKEVQREAVQTFKQALERQKQLIELLFDRFREVIPNLPANSFRVPDMIKLMEYETTYVFDEDRGMNKGQTLALVLQMMAPEERMKFNAAIERARDAGSIPLERMGSIGRN